MHYATPGTTAALLTKEPLGTESEMTPGPDDRNPYDEELDRKQMRAFKKQMREGPREPALVVPDLPGGRPPARDPCGDVVGLICGRR